MVFTLKWFKTSLIAVGIAALLSNSFAHLPSGRSLGLRSGAGKNVIATTNNDYTRTLADVSPWDKAKEYKGGKETATVTHGEFEGQKLYWQNSWWTKGEEPGTFADSGGTSPWVLINTKSILTSGTYEWKGWNSKASKWKIEHDNSWVFTETQDGDWGDQIDSKGAGAYLPTFRDGAEGAYSMTHDDIGAMSIDKSVKPCNDLVYKEDRITCGWGIKVDAMDDNEWKVAREMVMNGVEMINHSYDHTSAADQWQWHYMGNKLSADDPALPKEIRNLTIGTAAGTYKPLPVTIPYIDYEGGDITKPKKLYHNVTFQVSNDYEYICDSTEMGGWWEYTWKSKGTVKPEHMGWQDDASNPAGGSNVNMLKVFCVPGWTPSRYTVNINAANDLINKHVYDKVNSPHFQKGRKCDYYVYPYDAYSSVTHKALMEAGISAARGGGKSGVPLPGDFFHPFRIDFDAFFMLDANAEKVFPDNPHQRISLKGLADRCWKAKGYMIREFHAVADVTNWEDANKQSMGGWWGGIPKYLLKEHYEYLNELNDEHKITVYGPSEAVKYRMTCNAVTAVAISGLELSATTTGTVKEVYQDEISVICILDQAYDKMGAKYKDEDYPRYAPRKMDDAGKAWSISMNPFYNGGKITLTPGTENPEITGNIQTQKIAKVFSQATISKNALSCNLTAGKYTLSVYSMNGKALINKSFVSTGSNQSVTFNRSLSNGLYVYNISQNGRKVLQSKMMLK